MPKMRNVFLLPFVQDGNSCLLIMLVYSRKTCVQPFSKYLFLYGEHNYYSYKIIIFAFLQTQNMYQTIEYSSESLCTPYVRVCFHVFEIDLGT